MYRLLMPLLLASMLAIPAFAQGQRVTVDLQPSRSSLCAGDTFSLTYNGGSFSRDGSDKVYLSSDLYGGVIDTLSYVDVGDKLICQVRKSTVGASDYHLFLIQRGIVYASPTVIRVGNPLTASVPDSGYTYCFSRHGRVYFRSRAYTGRLTGASLAQKAGGKLASIGDSETNQRLAAFSDTAGTWFDFSDWYVVDAWRKDNFAKNPFVNWAPGEPNNAGGRERFGAVRVTGLWYDEFVNRNKRHFLEISTVSGDTIFTVPGGSLQLAGPKVAGATLNWFGPNGYFSTDTVARIPRTFIPTVGNSSDAFGLIVSVGGCQSDLIPYPIVTNYTLLDTALFTTGPVYRGRRYYVSRFTATLPNAARIAYLSGGLLAEVHDLQENQLIMAMRPADEKWLGLSDTAQDRVFRFLSSDTIATFFNWAPGEPNNHNGRESYVEMRPNGRWNDIFPELSIPFVLQVKESVSLSNPADLVVCPGSVDSMTYHTLGNVAHCRLELSSAAGTFDAPQRLSFTVSGTRVVFRYPGNLPMANGYKLRLVDTVRQLYDYPTPSSVEVSNGAFLQPILALVGDSVYVVNPYPGAKYQWFFNNGPLGSQGDSTYQIARADGAYSVAVNRNACAAQSAAVNYVATEAVIAKRTQLTVYPNPATESVRLNLPGGGYRYRLTDVRGRIVRQGESAEAETVLSLRDMPAGFYQVMVDTAKGTYRRKLVIR